MDLPRRAQVALVIDSAVELAAHGAHLDRVALVEPEVVLVVVVFLMLGLVPAELDVVGPFRVNCNGALRGILRGPREEGCPSGVALGREPSSAQSGTCGSFQLVVGSVGRRSCRSDAGIAHET